MKIYTKTGDEGMTSLVGDRRYKDDIRVEAYGTIDELNSFLQLAISKLPEKLDDIRDEMMQISQLLFDCASDLAVAKPGREFKLTDESTKWLETRIDEYISKVEDQKSFILPGGCEASSLVHICRTVTRRAERRIVTLKRSEEINNAVYIFINRLSDYFFILARLVNSRLGSSDVPYERSKKAFRK